MGDRANIYVVEKAWVENPDFNEAEGYSPANPRYVDEPLAEAAKQGVYLYTHWSGSVWPSMLREALLKAKSRWDDPAYCWRIVVSSLFDDIRDSETGGGISRSRPDNEYPITIMSLSTQEVAWCQEGEEKDIEKWGHKLSFEDFALLGVDYPIR